MALSVLGTATWAHAASILDFDVWMRLIDKRSVSVQRHIAAHKVDEAKADARDLEQHYALMETFFIDAGGAADAVRLSAEGRALAAQIPVALDRQDFPAAAQSALTLARACNDCHDYYKPFK